MQQTNNPDKNLDTDLVEFKYIENIMLNGRFKDEYNDKTIGELLIGYFSPSPQKCKLLKPNFLLR